MPMSDFSDSFESFGKWTMSSLSISLRHPDSVDGDWEEVVERYGADAAS